MRSDRLKCGGVVWAGAGVAWRLGVHVVFEAVWDAFLCVVLPRRGLCVQSTADF
jgi:hypothetical protein